MTPTKKWYQLPARLAFTLTLAAIASCSDDEKTAAPYVEELACLVTNANGRAVSFVSDNGNSYTLSNKVNGLRPDSTYRILALFTRDETNRTVWLTDYAALLAPKAAAYKSKAAIYNPLDVTSAWKGGGYINLRLAIKGTNGGTHYFGFNAVDTTASASGVKTVHVKLIHSQNNDPLYYTRESYICLPLAPFAPAFTAGTDSLSLSVETFSGEKVYRFPL